ncbi:MAG: RtcB family protein [Chlorobiaceae bacterium]|nr:RtcB family protein [Chlorobiaceae bacterium]
MHALRQLSPFLWEIPKTFRKDMRVPARIYASAEMLGHILQDRSLEQLLNVTTLPGIVQYALAMPDIHEGYGFPVGGVAAFDTESGIISPGGIGYDINCGVRLLRSTLSRAEVQGHLAQLGKAIFNRVPSGVGKGGLYTFRDKEIDRVLLDGAKRIIELGYGSHNDSENTESGGKLDTADPACVSPQAKSRGSDQLGTLGAGNHFVEVEFISAIYDNTEADRLGLQKEQVCVMVHTGSRGLGHQVATDAIRTMNRAMPRFGFSLPDRELACAPFNSPEGQACMNAMSAAANFAWANRQLVTWEIREAWKKIFGTSETLDLVYDIAHNIAKLEPYDVNSARKMLLVHRKGATRAFPGQPVLIPGSMGTGSWLLKGHPGSVAASFGSSCHGAGRSMSRTMSRKLTRIPELLEELAAQGIVVNAGSQAGLSEEAPSAYKNVDEVVNVIDVCGIAKKVARLRPLAVIKG